MATIGGSVGKGGVNTKDDVTTVQQLLNPHMNALGLPQLVVDGGIGKNTIDAIKAYQKQVVRLASPDGRIDPGGSSWTLLSAGTAPVAPPPLPAGSTALSGAVWWHANQANFPNSATLGDLASPFREKVLAFTNALKAAGATISVSATRRNQTRAWLMHHCWRIAREGLDPATIAPVADCSIVWDHGNAAASKRGAQEMVGLFGIAFRPSLTSLHIQGRAIDMTIGWSGALQIRDAAGAIRSIGAPRSGNTNPQLHAVGASYGVIKLASDPPHWSDTGH